MLAERRSLTRAGLSMLALLALASSACDSWLLIINPSSGGALLRIVNVGDRTVGNLVVLFPGERVTFGDLPGRRATPITRPARAYSVCRVRVPDCRSAAEPAGD